MGTDITTWRTPIGLFTPKFYTCTIHTYERGTSRSLATIVAFTVLTAFCAFYIFYLPVTHPQASTHTHVKQSISTDTLRNSRLPYNYSSFLLSCMDVPPNPLVPLDITLINIHQNWPSTSTPLKGFSWNSSYTNTTSLFPEERHHSKRPPVQMSSNYFHQQSLVLWTMAKKLIHLR